MEKRLNIQQTEPPAFKSMLALEGYVANCGINKTWKELIKIRASQLNNCAYCIDMHTKDALKGGEDMKRLFIVSAWREARKFFSEEEQVILDMTEQITLIHQGGLSAETYQQATRLFSENQIAQIIMVIVAINTWNRIAVSTHLEIV